MIRRHLHTIAGHSVRRIGNHRANQANSILTKAGVYDKYGTLHRVNSHPLSAHKGLVNRMDAKLGKPVISHVSRSQAAKEAAATRKAKGEKPFGGRTWKTYDATLTHAQRSAMAKKAAAARKREGIKPWGGHTWAKETAAQRHANALKAAATRRARGEKPFAHESAATRSAAAKRAAATRKARGGK